MREKYFFFGFGQVAKYYIDNLIKNKKKFNFNASSTSKTSSKFFRGKKYKSFKFKDYEFDKNIYYEILSSDYIIVSIPPRKHKDLVVENFGPLLSLDSNKKIIYLSATSVYGNHNGKWVSEKSKLKTKTNMGKDRLGAEKSWMKLFLKNKLNLNILRLSGIYSKEKNALKRLKNGPRIFIKKNNQFFSRIRVEDIARVLDKVLNNNKIKGEIFNISDDLPASNEEVTKYAAKLLNIYNLNSVNSNKLQGSIKDFFKDSKKVNNLKMKKILKIKLKYPSYKEGLRDLRNKSV